jgi:hypothetical protein
MDGYKPLEGINIQLVEDMQAKLSKEMEKAVKKPDDKKPDVKPDEKTTGTLILSVNVPWGNFKVDGQTFNNTKNARVELPEGDYTVRYSLPVIDFYQEKSVRVTRGGESSAVFSIKSGILQVETNIDIVVYIEDSPMGKDIIARKGSPYVIEVANGTYKVRAEKQNASFYMENRQVTQVKEAMVRPGEKTIVRFNVIKKTP